MQQLDILLVKEPWARKLVKGEKSWELRSTNVTNRGRIALGQTGKHLVLGEVTITSCSLVAERGADGKLQPPAGREGDWLGSAKNIPLHGVSKLEELPGTWKRVYAWGVASAREYQPPIPFKHVTGCQTWISPEQSKKAGSAMKRPKAIAMKKVK